MAQGLKPGDLIQPQHKVLRIVSVDPWTRNCKVADAAGVPLGMMSREAIEDYYEKVPAVACVAELLESVMAKVIAAHLPPGKAVVVPIAGEIEPRSRLSPEPIACPLCPSNFEVVGGEFAGLETLDPRTLWGHLREHHGMSVKTAASLMADPARNGLGLPLLVADGAAADEKKN